MDSPFDPESFADDFADALSSLCDRGTEIDLAYDEIRTAELFMTVKGIDYVVRITPADFDSA